MTDEILKKIEEEKVRFIDLEFTDIYGALKSIEIPAESLEDAIKNGVLFDGSSIKGFARIKDSDMNLMPDLSTFSIIPGEENKTGRFFCDIFTPDGEPFLGEPRAILKKVLGEAREMGYEFKVGPEVEFHLFRKHKDRVSIKESDNATYFDSPIGDFGSKIRKEVMMVLPEYNIKPERGHHEVGGVQHEIGFKYDDALITADRVIILKNVIRTIAHQYGLVASFMPKPRDKKPGSGMHVHFSLFGLDGKPIFYDENDPNKLSPLAKSFIAGQLAYIKEMAAITNPTVNSYKRLVLGYEAPVYICWGSKNRSALVRVPRYTSGKPNSVRGELRCPDPSGSPYLVFAAILKAGLAGIKNNLELMTETEENVFENCSGLDVLPASLDEAVLCFKKSRLMEDLVGKDFFKKYIEAKEDEVEEYRTAVTDWERKRYLEKC